MSATHRTFRFGFQSYTASSGDDWRAKAKRAEDWGYSSFTVADHYLGPGPALAAMNHPVQDIAAVPAMAVAAEATSTIKVGARVMCIDYRNPVVLVKEMATLDFFSGGRLEFGIGAGWLHGEYDSMGVHWDEAGVRIDRLGDVVRMAKQVMGDGEVSFRSEKPTSGVVAEGFEGLPKPVQRPHPPIMIGGGSKRVLRLAGAEADIVSLNFDNSSGKIGPGVPTSGADATEQKVQWIREGAGDRFDDLEIEIGAYFTFVTDAPEAIASGMGQRFGLSTEEMLAHPHALMGTVDSICDELERRRERYGISYVTVGDAVAEAFAPVVERLTGR
jgi:probable F420-dependent oxidoreductase